MKQLILTLLLLVAASSAEARMVSKTVEYTQGGTVLEGYLAYDDSLKGKAPGVLVVHDWTGLGIFAKLKAERLAAKGYVAFAADIYGKGIRPRAQDAAAREAGKYKADRQLLRARAQAALDELRRVPVVDPEKLGAIGYCFGGTTVLEMARSGARLAGVVSFHGGLDTPNSADAKNITGKVLVLHGADDPFVTPQELNGFVQEMRAARVDWQIVQYGDAVHSFTNPEAGRDKSKGAAYNEKADKRSWKAMEQFFEELFGRREGR